MNDCLHCAHVLDGPLKGRKLDADDLDLALEDGNFTWVHLRDDEAGLRDWLQEKMPFLKGWVLDTLSSPDVHSRATVEGDGLFIVLRSINVNPGADPLEMVALRMWVDSKRIISVSSHPVAALEAVTQRAEAGEGPATPGAFIAAAVERLGDRLEPQIQDLDEKVDGLEARVVNDAAPSLRREIAELRMDLIRLRRHTPSQRQTLADLIRCGSPLLAPEDLRVIAENHARMSRLSENVEELRDSLLVLRDDLSGQLEDRLNRHMYTLSVISAIFLPLTFVTGLLGINVEGIPGAGNVDSFWIVTLGLLIFAGFMVAVLRWFHWMD